MDINLLSEDEKSKVFALANARGETTERIIEKFGSLKQIKRMPQNYGKFFTSPIHHTFSDSGIRDGHPYVVLPNQRILYGNFPKKNYYRYYEYLGDLYSNSISKETCCVAMDVSRRYYDPLEIPDKYMPSKNGTLVEVGAYLGHKTIKFCDEYVGLGGSILAIEAVPENYELLKRNIEENRLNRVIDSLQIGVWNKKEVRTILGKGYQQNSLVQTDTHDFQSLSEIQTDTLDNILRGWKQRCIDLLTIQVNGAEIEVLEGLNQYLEKIKILYIVSPYSREGHRTIERCKELLLEKECTILEETNETSIYAVTKYFKEAFL
ncbi:methyltransferase, FkbM family [Tindallia magadiensis]|uniref:Methyltransferase, FkbM family n=1 Tax=Tindallia magadiensis TaxID=69895 RepID=A0A1I3D2Z3_9FIRM|nr:FkbM family methyltransferase [Tindallia magadiensis]SFH81144.1 methyltransferase, FkbM family [Tindallia magadiensis]